MFERLRSIISRSTRTDNPTTPLGQAFMSPLSAGGAPPRLGTQDLLKSYSEMPWLRAIVNKVGKAIGTTTWELYIDKPNSKQASGLTRKAQRADMVTRKGIITSQRVAGLEEVQDHPLLDLLCRPNTQMTGTALFQISQIHIDLVGEAFWLLERNGLGIPVAIYPLPPHWIRNFPTSDDPWYAVQIGNNGVPLKVPVTEIIPFIDPDPLNPYARGTGIAKSLGDELETDEYAAKHLKTFFFNRARPDLIISADNLSRADTANLEARWNQEHQGFWKAFKPQFLNRKVDVKEVGQNFQHMQMVELRKHERDTIIQVFGIPPEKLGIVNESKRSTISAADLFWARDILEPRLEFIREALQIGLVPLFDDKLILDYRSPVIRDDEHRLEVMKASPHWFTQNEWRMEAQKPALPDGDDLMQPINHTRTDLAGEPVIEPPEVPGTEEGESQPPENSEEEESKIFLLGDFTATK